MFRMKILLSYLLAVTFNILSISAQAEEQSAALDNIFGLERVSDISLGPEDELLVLTLPDRILIYQMFPLSLVQDVRLDVRGYASALSDAGNLFVLGDDPKSSKDGYGIGGSVRVYEDVLNITDFSDPNVPGVFPLDTTPFTELLLTEAGDLFVSNPTSLSILRSTEKDTVGYLAQVRAFLDGKADTLEQFVWDSLTLQCATSNAFSAFTEGQRTIYLSSAIGSKVLEMGPVQYNQRENEFTDCYSPDPDVLTRSLKLDDLRGTPLQHALVDTPSFLPKMDEYIMDTGLLSFDPSSADLTFIPVEYFDGFASFVRTKSMTFNLTDRLNGEAGESQLGLLASDEDGAEIMLAIAGSKRIHRIQWTGTEFSYAGRFDLPRPVKQLVAGPEGKHFVAALGGDGDPEQVLIIRDANLIPAFDGLPNARYSVQLLQSTWNAATDGNLNEDGILGPATSTVVKDLTASGTFDAIEAVGSPPLRNTVLSLFPTAFD